MTTHEHPDDHLHPHEIGREVLHGDGEYQDEHRDDTASGVFRAAVFGASDGLVSTVGLVVGVAAGSSSNQTAVLLAGAAGLLAGAFSMAAGEWVSMRTQRELFEREIALEREHIERFPQEEEAHLARLLRANGLDDETADRVANEVHREVEPALEFHARFELGINPQELGSPVGAAVGSFLSFVVGGLVPLVPWFFAAGMLVWSVVASAVGLLVLGALVTRFTQQNPVRSALRQLSIGAASAAITYVIGYLIGANVS